MQISSFNTLNATNCDTCWRTSLGFSIIELSVTIVIVALLLAGAMTATNQLSQANLRSAIAEMQGFRSMYQSFDDQYKRVPGDMANASTIWTGATCTLGASCDGNGNGVIEAVFSSANDETNRAWKHLQLAGILEVNINQLPVTWAGVLVVGTMTPKSKISNAGYYMAAGSDIGGDALATVIPSPWTDNRTNAVFLGMKSSSATSNGLTIGVLTAREAYNLDKKFDDGSVNTSGNNIGFGTGKIRALNDSTGTSNCVNGTTSYVMSSSAKVCLVGYQLHDRNL